jgi:hypothetical protein
MVDEDGDVGRCAGGRCVNERGGCEKNMTKTKIC